MVFCGGKVTVLAWAGGMLAMGPAHPARMVIANVVVIANRSVFMACLKLLVENWSAGLNGARVQTCAVLRQAGLGKVPVNAGGRCWSVVSCQLSVVGIW